MGHFKALQLKTLADGLPVLFFMMTIARLYWVTAILATLGLTTIAYLLGDSIVLPAAGNLVATIADAGLAAFYLWGLQFIGIAIHPTAILYTTLAILLVEGLIYHPYLKRLATFDATGPRIGDRR